MVIDIKSYEDLQDKLIDNDRNYLLIYKSNTETGNCSYTNIEKASKDTDIDVMVTDVLKVRDIHGKYNISTSPTLLIFNGKQFTKTIKGCNSDKFYKGILENKTTIAKQSSTKTVIVYSTPSCTWCNTLKRYFREKGVTYRDIDVSKNQREAENMVRRSGQQGVPQTIIDGNVIIGFDKNRIDKLLNLN